MTDKNRKDIESYLETMSPKVQNNVKIFSPTDNGGRDYMLHISKNTKIKEFIPAISTRQGSKEDRTVPRVTVAPTLLGCIIGYIATIHDFHGGVTKDNKFLGGYAIYELPFEYCLAPTARLVYDSNISDEYWIVNYNKETAITIPKMAGKFFYRSINYVNRGISTPTADVVLYIEVTKEEGIPFSKRHFLEKGCYVIEGPLHTQIDTWKDDKDFTVSSIDPKEYRDIKFQSADMLSINDAIPNYLNW